ncbi:MAG TPA: sigma-70 family RNA polymerase sigma factor [Ktedonobacterales bacterium]
MRPGYGAQPACAGRTARGASPSRWHDADSELARLLACDPAAGFEQLARNWQNRLYAFALRMSGSPADAEDIAQETLVRAWRALATYSEERRASLQVRAWLFQIAVNLVRNSARSASHATTLSLDDPGDVEAGALHTLAERLPDTDLAGVPEESLERRLRRELLAHLLLRLPKAQRLALVLRHIEGMTYDEISAITGLPIGTLKSHASRGASELRRALEREETREAYRDRLEQLS